MSEPYSCAVLFADISGSTQLYEELGDAQALSRIDACLRLLRDAALEFGGRVVKTTGDGVMCAFDQAEAALHAARFMQVRLAAQAALGGPPLAIHVGCHYGAVLENDADLYGDCVNVAVRVVGLAKAGQIIATQEVVGKVGENLRNRVRMPLHEHCLFKNGIHLGEMWYLTELAGWLRNHGRNRFLLTAPPLRLPGAVGSPATPVATV